MAEWTLIGSIGYDHYKWLQHTECGKLTGPVFASLHGVCCHCQEPIPINFLAVMKISKSIHHSIFPNTRTAVTPDE